MPEPIAEIPVRVLASMIGKTVFAISMEESRFTLNGALLLLRKGGLTMVATDGHRLAMSRARRSCRASTSSVSRAGAAQGHGWSFRSWRMTRTPTPRCSFSGDDNHLFFEVGQRLLITRKLTGNFPDYERVLPKDQPLSVDAESRGDSRGAIERVAQFADERSRAIRVQFTAGEVKILSSVVGNRRERRERSSEYRRARPSRSASTPNTCWIFCARSRRNR